MRFDLPEFKSKKEKFAYLKENEDMLIMKKKSAIKYADAFSAPSILLREIKTDSEASKSVNKVEGDKTQVKVRAIINTTKVFDSHYDVHIDGIWNKTLKESKNIKHLQEHEMKFDKIISDKDDLKAFTKNFKWKDLGYDKDGETQALVFDSIVKQERNEYMFNQYSKGNVDNHSVGMIYVTIKLALNSEDEDDEKYKAEYDKHIDDIINKEEVEAAGFYFAIYEAKVIEGSAVPIGSNQITPTLSIEEKNDKLETSEYMKGVLKFLNINEKL